jgi:hypothetical protein
MNDYSLITLKEARDYQRFFDLLKDMRTHLSFEEFQKRFNEVRKADNYTMIGIEENDQIVALIGYRILHDFVHGKHLYIDDLISAATHRSKGYGAWPLKICGETCQGK